MIRLNKYIADSGYCSRREADAYIAQGRVTVNNIEAPIGYAVQAMDRVKVDGELIKGGANAKKRIYIALNKPVGVTSTTDLKDHTNIVDYVKHRERIFPIGRLDKPSQGLILLTNDGNIVNKILRAGNAHQKEYVVTVNKSITPEFLKRMSEGMTLDGGDKTLPCKIVRETERRFRIFLIQGLNRQIRRMCMMLDYDVEKLERVRIMNITLKGLPVGKWRELTGEEVDTIMEMVASSDNGEDASTTVAEPKRESKRSTYSSFKRNLGTNQERGGKHKEFRSGFSKPVAAKSDTSENSFSKTERPRSFGVSKSVSAKSDAPNYKEFRSGSSKPVAAKSDTSENSFSKTEKPKSFRVSKSAGTKSGAAKKSFSKSGTPKSATSKTGMSKTVNAKSGTSKRGVPQDKRSGKYKR